MLPSLVQSTYTTPFQSTIQANLKNTDTGFLPKSRFPSSDVHHPSKALKKLLYLSRRSYTTASRRLTTNASLLEAPVLWAGRLCIFYALLKAGLAGSKANPLVSGIFVIRSYPCFCFHFFLG